MCARGLQLCCNSGVVKRHESVRVDFLRECGRPASITAHGFIAGVLQHEYDHLNGILFTDRMEKDVPDTAVLCDSGTYTICDS